MKKTAIAAILFLLSATASASDLVWDASAGGPKGYVIYYGAGPIPAVVDTDSPNVGVLPISGAASTRVQDIDSIFLIPPGAAVWFAASAYNDAGESAPCPPIEYVRTAYDPPEPRMIDLGGGIPEPPANVTAD